MVQGAKSILFNSKGEVLMLKRDDGVYLGGTWSFPGGFVEGRETPHMAASRENQEEIGVSPRIVLAKIVIVPGRDEWEQTGVPVFVFVGTKPINEVKLGEGQDYQFFPVNKLPLLSTYTRRVAEGILF